MLFLLFGLGVNDFFVFVLYVAAVTVEFEDLFVDGDLISFNEDIFVCILCDGGILVILFSVMNFVVFLFGVILLVFVVRNFGI